MSANKNERVARAIIAMKLIVKSENGYTISTPALRGVSTSFEVVNGGECTCFAFEENQICPHTVAADILAAEEVAAKPTEKCFWCLDETITGDEGEPVYCAFCGRKSEADFINWETFETGDDYFHASLPPKQKAKLCKTGACNEYGTPAVKDDLCIDCYEQKKSEAFYTVGEIDLHYSGVV